MRTVEFVGVRAVGKSTMMRYLVATLPHIFVDASDPDRKGLDWLKQRRRAVGNDMTFPQHAAFEAHVREMCTRLRFNPQKQPRSYWIALRDLDELRAREDDRIAIFDQGLVQYTRGLTIQTRSVTEVGKYLGAVPVPDVIVMFNVTKETCVARNKERGSVITPGHLDPMFDSMRYIAALARTQVLHIDGERRIEEKAHDIIQQLKSVPWK